MANIGIILPTGMIAVYGPGYQTAGGMGMPSGVILGDNFRFGTVYNIWDGGATYVYGGNVVWWDETTVEPARIVTQTLETYTLLPARLVTKDSTVIPP